MTIKYIVYIVAVVMLSVVGYIFGNRDGYMTAIRDVNSLFNSIGEIEIKETDSEEVKNDE